MGWRARKRASAAAGSVKIGRACAGGTGAADAGAADAGAADADAGLSACIMQRSKRGGKGASRKMGAVAGVCSMSRRLVRDSGAPPPRARTTLLRPRDAERAWDSNWRKGASPWAAKMEGTARPGRDSIEASRSRKSQPRRAASRRPTVVLPAPIKPVRTIRRRWAGRIKGLAGSAVWLALGSAVWTFITAPLNITTKARSEDKSEYGDSDPSATLRVRMTNELGAKQSRDLCGVAAEWKWRML